MTPLFMDAYRRRSAGLLDTALERVAAYASWKKLDPGPDAPVDERYRALPALTKADLRTHTWRGFVPEGADPDGALERGEIELVATSGTTAEQVTNVWHQGWWDGAERASWNYNTHTAGLGGHREAILTSPHNAGRLSDCRRLSREERSLGRFLYLNERSSPARWTPALLDRMLDELERFQPAVIEANPPYLARLALHARHAGRRPYQPAVIVLTYGNPTPLARRLIRLAFDAPLASSYGSTEAGYALMECEHGNLHQVHEACRIDFEPLRGAHGGPDLGRLLLSTFGNPWRVLVRFDAGDLARRLPEGACPCGRDHGFIFREVAGRAADLTFTTDGRAVAPADVDAALADVAGLAAYSVTQKCRTAYEAAVETCPGARKNAAVDAVRARLIDLYGRDANVRAAAVAQVPAECSGKYRPTRALFALPPDELFASASDAAGRMDA